MSWSNETKILKLPLYVGTDYPSWITDWNYAMKKLESSYEETQAIIESLQDDIHTLDGALNAVKTQLQGLADTVSAYYHEFTEFKQLTEENITRLEGLINEINSTVEILQQNIATIQEKITEIEAKNAEQDEKLEQLEGDNTTITQDITNLQQDVQTINQTLATLSTGGFSTIATAGGIKQVRGGPMYESENWGTSTYALVAYTQKKKNLNKLQLSKGDIIVSNIIGEVNNAHATWKTLTDGEYIFGMQYTGKGIVINPLIDFSKLAQDLFAWTSEGLCNIEQLDDSGNVTRTIQGFASAFLSNNSLFGTPTQHASVTILLPNGVADPGTHFRFTLSNMSAIDTVTPL